MTKIGDTVIYKPTDEDKDRLSYKNCGDRNNEFTPHLPAIVVNVFNDKLVNLKVLVDGETPFLWKTSVAFGEGVGQWLPYGWEKPQA